MSFNWVSPFGRAVKYEPLPYKGFYTHPKSDFADSGWSPATDAEGNPSFPGTPDGISPYRFFGRKDGESGPWYGVHSPGTFFYGEIDWRGPRKNAEKEYLGRWRLTFHGPVGRYFANDAFSYGADPHHHNIYMEGRCVAVAPYPVLGAALRQVGEEHWIFVVCKDGVLDRLYKKRLLGGVMRVGYTDEYREESMRPYHEVEAPNGWIFLQSFFLRDTMQKGEGVVSEARVPWFFNESGTAAVCVRECSLPIEIPGVGTQQQIGYNIFRMDIGDDDLAIVVDLQNLNGFSVAVSSEAAQMPNHVAETRWPDTEGTPITEHTWEVFRIRTIVTMQGAYTVAADYVGDVLRRADIRAQNLRKYTHFMYRGADSPEHPYSNENDRAGDTYTFDNTPIEETDLSEPFYITTQVMALDDRVLLDHGQDELHWVYRRLSGARSEFETGVRDPEDVYLHYVFCVSNYPHFWDIRDSHTAVFSEEVTYQTLSQTTRTEYRSEQYFSGKATDYEMYMTAKESEETQSNGTLGWTWAQLENDFTLGDNRELSFLIIDGDWPMEIFAPGTWPSTHANPVDFHSSTDYKFNDLGVPIHERLQSISKSYRELGSGIDDFGNRAVSIKYLDHEGEVRYFNRITEGDMEQIAKTAGPNARFYPIGVS